MDDFSFRCPAKSEGWFDEYVKRHEVLHFPFLWRLFSSVDIILFLKKKSVIVTLFGAALKNESK